MRATAMRAAASRTATATAAPARAQSPAFVAQSPTIATATRAACPMGRTSRTITSSARRACVLQTMTHAFRLAVQGARVLCRCGPTAVRQLTFWIFCHNIRYLAKTAHIRYLLTRREARVFGVALAWPPHAMCLQRRRRARRACVVSLRRDRRDTGTAPRRCFRCFSRGMRLFRP